MDIIFPPTTDLIKATVLSAQGDLVVRGVAVPERLGLGTLKSLLRVNIEGTGLEFVDVPTSVEPWTHIYTNFSTLHTKAMPTGIASIGPTGSGAARIWSVLDGIPAETKYVIVELWAYVTRPVDAAGDRNVSMDVLYNDANNYYFGGVRAHAYNTDAVGSDKNTVLIPLDSNKMFKGNFTHAVSTNSTNTIYAFLIGYIKPYVNK